MFTTDFMVDFPYYSDPVLVVSSEKNPGQSDQTSHSVGVCAAVPNYPGADYSGYNLLFPFAAAANFLNSKGVINNDTDIDLLEASSEAQLVMAPSNGAIVVGGNGAYSYIPNAGFIGKDRVAFRVGVLGRSIRIFYYIESVNHDLGSDWQSRLCNSGKRLWQISALWDFKNTSINGSLKSNGDA